MSSYQDYAVCGNCVHWDTKNKISVPTYNRTLGRDLRVDHCLCALQVGEDADLILTDMPHMLALTGPDGNCVGCGDAFEPSPKFLAWWRDQEEEAEWRHANRYTALREAYSEWRAWERQERCAGQTP